MTDNGFSLCEKAGITMLKDLFERGTIMSFAQLRLKYKLPQTHFFRFLQERGFIQTGYNFNLDINNIYLIKIHGNGFILRWYYEALCKSCKVDNEIMQTWAQDLGVEIDDDTKTMEEC